MKLNASTPTQTASSTRQHTGELFISVVSTCATHRSDGNAPQTPLSQSDILNERTPLRLNFEKKDPLLSAKTQRSNPLTSSRNTCHPQAPATGVWSCRFPPTVHTFPRGFARPSSLRWLRGNKSNLLGCTSCCCCGSCARREGPSSNLGVVVLQTSESGLQTVGIDHKTVTFNYYPVLLCYICVQLITSLFILVVFLFFYFTMLHTDEALLTENLASSS